MAYSATFKYNNLDATTDLNLPTRILSSKGVVSGFGITPVAGTSNITVAAGYLVSNDGMIVQSTAPTTLACMTGVVNYIVFRAVYNSPADPTLLMQVLTQSNYNSDPQKPYLVLVGTVDLTAVTQVSNNVISYDLAHRVDVQARDTFLGVFNTSADLQAAYTAALPTKQRSGDYALVLVDTQAKPAIYIWIAGSMNWLVFGNYEDLLLNYNVHTSGVAATGQTAHLTASEKSAVTGTFGTPGPTNRFVTETDLSLLLTTAEKDAINGAITGPSPLSATNPLVADGIPVAVPRAVGVTTISALDYVTITYGDLSNGTPYFGNSVFTGKLGLDDAGHSTAKHWFRLQDQFDSGYVDSDGPLYVVDILTGDGSGSFNPGSDSSVTPIGYWKGPVGAPQTALRVKFNRVLAVGKTVYVSYYAAGSISLLAPTALSLSSRNVPATALSTAKDAYREINTAKITNLIGTAVASATFSAAPGSPTSPSYTFVDGSNAATHSGFFYLGDVVESNYSFYKAVGVSVNGANVLLLASNANVDTLDTVEVPFVIEQVYPDTTYPRDALTYRLFAYAHTSAVSNLRVSMGVSSYSAGYRSAFYVNGLGTTFERDVTFVAGKQLLTDVGTAARPALAIGSTGTGFYSIAEHASPNPSFYNAVALTLGGKTAFVFSTNDSSGTGLTPGLASPLMFEEVNGEDGFIDYRIAIMQAAASAANAGAIRFGKATYNTDFVEYGHFDSLGNLYALGTVTGTSVAVGGGLGTFSATGAGMTLIHNGVTKYTYAVGTDTTTISSARTVLTGTLKLSNGTETAPALTFSDTTGTGLFYAGYVTGTTEAFAHRSIGVSIEGETVLLVGRSEEYASGTLDAIAAPLLITQHVHDAANVELRISGASRTAAVTSTLVLGTSDYNVDFRPAISIGVDAIAVAYRTEFATTVTAGSLTVTGQGSFGSINCSGIVHGAGASANSVAFATSTAINTGLYGTDVTVGLARFGSAAIAITGVLGGGNLTTITGRLTVSNTTTFQADVVGEDAVWSGASVFNGPVTLSSIVFASGASASGNIVFNGNVSIVGTLEGSTGTLTFASAIAGPSGSLAITGSASVSAGLVVQGSAAVVGGLGVGGTGVQLNAGQLTFAGAAGGQRLFSWSHDNTTDAGVETLYLVDGTGTTTEVVLAIPTHDTVGDATIKVSRGIRLVGANTTISSTSSISVWSDGNSVTLSGTMIQLASAYVSATGYVSAAGFRVPWSEYTSIAAPHTDRGHFLRLTLNSPRYFNVLGVLGSDTFYVQLPMSMDGSCVGVEYVFLLSGGHNLVLLASGSDVGGEQNCISNGDGTHIYVSERTFSAVDRVTVTGSVYVSVSGGLHYCWICSA